MGLFVAFEEFINRDEEAAISRYTEMANYIYRHLSNVPGLTASLVMTHKGYPDVSLNWDRNLIPLDEKQVASQLQHGEYRVAYMPNPIIYAYDGPTLVTALLRPGEEILVAHRVREFFVKAAIKS